VLDVLAPRLGCDRRETADRTGTTEGGQHLAAPSRSSGRAILASIDLATKLDGTGTADLITQISREVHKQLRFIEAHLQGAR
jgi:DNA-binding ferritin-like protein